MATPTPCARVTKLPERGSVWPTRLAAQPPARRATRSDDSDVMKPRRRILTLTAAAAAAVLLWLTFGRRTRAAGNDLAGNGTVEATEIDVGAQRPARLLRILVKEGDRVKKGQLLGVLNPGELEAQAQQARGAVGAARAQLTEAERGARVEQVEAARGTLAAAQAN